MDHRSYYSDEYAMLCLELFKFNSNIRFYECINKYYFLHPEMICKIINDYTDEYVNVNQLSLHYELPDYACNDFDKLNSFVKCIINNTKNDKKEIAYEFIGRLLARELYDDRCENTNIFQVIENFSNENFNYGFVRGYDSIDILRSIGDGSKQRNEYEFLNRKAESIEIDFSRTATLLRKIAKKYLSESKTDYVISELGLAVL